MESVLSRGLKRSDRRDSRWLKFHFSGGFNSQREPGPHPGPGFCRVAGDLVLHARIAAMNTLLRDLRFAARSFAKSPGFTAAAVLSLALGIGANTIVFSIVSALLLRPLPYRDANRLVILWNTSPGLGITQDWFSTAQYFDIKNGHKGLEEVALAIGGRYNLTGQGDPIRVGVVRTSSNLLPMLGERAEQGRLFTAEEDSVGRPATAILGYGIWVRHYGADPHMIGRSITINGQPYEVVGIMPRTFSLPHEVLPTLDS